MTTEPAIDARIGAVLGLDWKAMRILRCPKRLGVVSAPRSPVGRAETFRIVARLAGRWLSGTIPQALETMGEDACGAGWT